MNKSWLSIFVVITLFLGSCHRSYSMIDWTGHSMMEESYSMMDGTRHSMMEESEELETSARPSLAIPELLDTAEGKVILRAQKGHKVFMPNSTRSDTMGYNGNFLGPTILLHRGHRAQIEIINELGEGTTLHSHGAVIPGAADGGPQQLIPPGKSWLLDFVVKQQAATLWYHPHKMGSTASQVWQGLAGVYIVQDQNSGQSKLPQDYGENDIPVVVQERALDKRGKMYAYKEMLNHMTVMHGVSGNYLLTNGQIKPEFRAALGWLRLRLLNGSNASTYRFSLRAESPVEFYQIASEQSLLFEAQKKQYIDLAAGGRAEIMLRVKDSALRLELAIWNENLTSVSGNIHEVLSILPDPTRKSAGELPKVLRSRDSLSPDELRDLTLVENAQALAKLPQRSLETEMRHMGFTYKINGKSYNMGRIDFEVKQNRYEVWHLSSNLFAHPVHIHGAQFRILRSALAPEGLEGWHDTVSINASREASILVRFPERAGPDSPYMVHCHM